MPPQLPSHLEVGLHEKTLKNALNESEDGRLRIHAEQLTRHLRDYIQSTERKVAIRQDYRLNRGLRLKALNNTSSCKDEDRLDATIHKFWRQIGQKDDFLRRTEDAQPIVKFIPCNQVPMYNQGGRGGKKDWGYIDLLGCGFADDPVVIELKILRFNKGGKPRPETPLRAVVEALAYAISLRESWAIFHPQWKLGVGSQRALAKPSGLSLVVLGTTGYWKGVGESSWIEQAEQAMPEFIAAVKAEGFPCHFAEIDAECVSSKNRNWIIKGPAKEISPW